MTHANTIITTRIINAPRERVFQAFSDPQQVVRWWGPNGFTNTLHKLDFKPDGEWLLTMHSPDGVDYDNKSVFTAITVPEQIIYQHLEPIHQFTMTMDFEEQDDKTKLTWTMHFDSDEEYAEVKEFIADANEQNFDRLEEHLHTTSF